MYGNTSFGDDPGLDELTEEERKLLNRELSSVAARTRELLPGEFVVGSELTHDMNGPRATLAVEPPIGAVVSANYVPEGEINLSDEIREDLAVGLAASAAFQVKQTLDADRLPAAR